MSDVAKLMQEGFEHLNAGRIPQAAKSFEQVLHRDPNNADARHELGLLHGLAGRQEHALALLQSAAELAPGVAPFHINLGTVLLRLKEPARAAESLRRALDLEPGDHNAAKGYALALVQLGRLSEAADICRRLLVTAPEAAIFMRLARALQETGKLDEALDALQRAQQLEPANHAAVAYQLMTLNYHDRYTPQEIFAAHQAFGERFPRPTLPPARPARADDRLRIAYLSPDLCQHSVAFFIWPILMKHDRTRVHVTCYADVGAPDAISQELARLPDQWHHVARATNEQLAERIADDDIDILIELAGHTGNNRLPLLASRKLAPVQVTYLGYPNTTGVRSIDYRITDALADPVRQTEMFHTETLLRMPDAFFCYITPGGLPDVNALPAQSRGHVTFAVFTNFAKIRPATMELWARILHALPRSRLMIQANALNDPPTREATIAFFAQRGIEPGRIELRGWMDFPVFVKVFADVDIVLDTFPFNGHTTTCQALWMGVPVVTLAGVVHRSRMGLSVMTNLGCPELVAHDAEQYVRIAIELAGDLSRLSALRASLRQRMRESRLLDSVRFTRHLEELFARIAIAR